MAVDIHKRIRDLRKTKGMSAKDVSERMGISRPFYTQLEGGTRRLSVQYLEGIAQALGTTVADLYCEDGLPAYPDVVAKAIPSNNPSRLAERLRPYLGENSDNAAESLYNLDKATKSLRKFKAENK